MFLTFSSYIRFVHLLSDTSNIKNVRFFFFVVVVLKKGNFRLVVNCCWQEDGNYAF